MKKYKPIILRKETYLKMIENSVGSRIFNSIFALYNGEQTDILRDGEVSCAVFASSLLLLNSLTTNQRATVNSLEKDLLASPQFIKILDVDYRPQSGDVVIWENLKFSNGTVHRHIGFILNSKEAVSTDYKNKCVARHPIFNNSENPEKIRKIESIFRYSF